MTDLMAVPAHFINIASTDMSRLEDYSCVHFSYSCLTLFRKNSFVLLLEHSVSVQSSNAIRVLKMHSSLVLQTLLVSQTQDLRTQAWAPATHVLQWREDGFWGTRSARVEEGTGIKVYFK